MLPVLRPERPVTKVLSPGKINHFLRVLSPRSDGFHELLLDFMPVSLCDVLTISPAESPGISVLNPAFTNPEDDLIYNALRLLEESMSVRLAVKVHVQKRIPMGAGMGGGSSNAGTALTAVRRLCKIPISDDDLASLALRLGSDVPFFLEPKAGIFGGRGEKLMKRLNFEPFKISLIFPPFHVSTVAAFGALKSSRQLQPIKREIDTQFKYVNMITHEPQVNDFWHEAHPDFSRLNLLREQAIDCGFQAVFMTGTGSTLYALLADRGAGQKLQRLAGVNVVEVLVLSEFKSELDSEVSL